MPNLRPKVRIIQDFDSPAITAITPELPPVIVGPAYHVEDNPDKLQLEVGNYLKGADFEISEPPANTSGALLDPDSVEIHLRNVLVRIPDALGVNGEIAAEPANYTVTISGADLEDLGVMVGDQIVLTHAGWTNQHVTTISSLLYESPNTIVGLDAPASEVGTSPVTDVSFEINRRVDDVTLPADHPGITIVGNTVTLSETLNVNVSLPPVDDYQVYSATVIMTYRSLRQDLNNLVTINSIAEVETKIGKITPDNPLALGAFMALLNTSTSIKVYGILGDNVGGASDRGQAYLGALEALENREDVYYLVPLANETSILTSFLAHCNAMSDPDISRFRRTLGSGFLPDYRITAPLSTGTTEESHYPKVLTVTTPAGGLFDSSHEGVAPGMLLSGFLSPATDLNSTFVITKVLSENSVYIEDLPEDIALKGSHSTITITVPGGTAEAGCVVTIRGVLEDLEDTTGNFANASVGQYVAIPIGGYQDFSEGYESFQIVEKYHNNRVRIDPLENYGELPTNATETAGVTTDYRVQMPLDKQGQAEDLAAYATSFGDARLTLCWPGDVTLQDQSGYHEGYYLAAAVAGKCANYPSHQNLTGLPLSGVTQLRYSSEYFNDSQIDMIMAGGWNVYTQATPQAAPSSLRALTTDTSFLETMELMIGQNFDFVSLFFRDLLRPFLKGYNVTPNTINLLSDAFNGGAAKLQARQYRKIGSTILGANLVSIALMEGTSDHIKIVATVDLPRPLNTITLMLTA